VELDYQHALGFSGQLQAAVLEEISGLSRLHNESSKSKLVKLIKPVRQRAAVATSDFFVKVAADMMRRPVKARNRTSGSVTGYAGES
jgi:hypothetical protein